MKKIDPSFWKDKKVFITGHTGFKGSWMSIWLQKLGAKITGYSLSPPTSPSLYELAKIETIIENSIIADINDLASLKKAILTTQPEIIIHMAAQSLVRESYENPVSTFQTNVMGTVNVLEAAREIDSIKVILNVTTDKCYDNQEWYWGYRETDPLGGNDPYSSSKACSELVTSAYRRSFLQSTNVQVATARAGNVIGGGDWAKDRLIPDIIKSFESGKEVVIRYPEAVRPWQHVLEPLSGYLLLCQYLFEYETGYDEAWNFGPHNEDAKSVQWILEKMLYSWPTKTPGFTLETREVQHEAKTLKLDCSKSYSRLNWTPTWTVDNTIAAIVDWYSNYLNDQDILEFTRNQIHQFENDFHS